MKRLPLAALFLVVIGLSMTATVRAGDWTHWRGPTQNGVAPDTGLPDAFKVDKPGNDNLIWKVPHGCRSTPIVLGGRVFFNSHTGTGKSEQESVVCVEADSGKEL